MAWKRVHWLMPLLIFCVLPRQAMADFWADAKDDQVTSENSRYGAHITIANEKSPCRVHVFSIQGNTTTALWSATLSNPVRPLKAYLSNDGEYLVTQDDYYSMGYGDNVVAFYSRRGQICRWPFKRIFPQFSPTLWQTVHDKLEDTHPALEDWLPGRGSDPMLINHYMTDTSASRFWTENGIAFLDSHPVEPAFCVWLGWDMRWIAWDIKSGQMLWVTRARKKRWDEHGRAWALEKLKSGQPDGGAMSLLSQIRRPEDRALIEQFRKYPDFNGWGSCGNDLSICSTVRKLADLCLANWDGLSHYGVNREQLEDNQYYFLGSVRMDVKFPRPPIEQYVYAYLIPESIGLEHWRDQKPENYFVAFPNNDPKAEKYQEFFLTIHGVPPGRYWIKVIWDAAPPFTNRVEDHTMQRLCNPQSGDYVSEETPFITVEAGKVLQNVPISCTHLVN